MLKYTVEYVQLCLNNNNWDEITKILNEAIEMNDSSYHENLEQKIFEDDLLFELIKRNAVSVLKNLKIYDLIGQKRYNRDFILLSVCEHVKSEGMLEAIKPVLDQFIKQQPNTLVSLGSQNESPLQTAVRQNNMLMAKYILEGFRVNHTKINKPFHSMFKFTHGLKTNNEMHSLLNFYGANLLFLLDEDLEIDMEPFIDPEHFNNLVNSNDQSLICTDKAYWTAYLSELMNFNKADKFITSVMVLLDHLDNNSPNIIPSAKHQMEMLERISHMMELEKAQLELEIQTFKNKPLNRVRRGNDAIIGANESNKMTSSTLYVVFFGLMMLGYVYWVFHTEDLLQIKHHSEHKINRFCNNTEYFNFTSTCMTVPEDMHYADYNCTNHDDNAGKIFKDLYLDCYKKKTEFNFSLTGLVFFGFYMMFYFSDMLFGIETLEEDRACSGFNFCLMKAPSHGLSSCIGSYNPNDLIKSKVTLIEVLKNLVKELKEFYLSGPSAIELSAITDTLAKPSTRLKPEDLVQVMFQLNTLIGIYALRIHFLPANARLADMKLETIKSGFDSLCPDLEHGVRRLLRWSRPRTSYVRLTDNPTPVNENTNQNNTEMSSTI